MTTKKKTQAKTPAPAAQSQAATPPPPEAAPTAAQDTPPDSAPFTPPASEPPPRESALLTLWLDLEMTGLDPTRDVILEYAIIRCADGPGQDFSIQTEDTGTLFFNVGTTDIQIDPYVREMHTQNDLWADCLDTPKDHDHAWLDAHLCAVAREMNAKPRSIILAGSSVHFDAKFLAAYCPRFSEYLSHRVRDVTALHLEAIATFGAELWPIHPPGGELGPGDHRALADIKRSIESAKFFREVFMVPRGMFSEGDTYETLNAHYSGAAGDA